MRFPAFLFNQRIISVVVIEAQESLGFDFSKCDIRQAFIMENKPKNILLQNQHALFARSKSQNSNLYIQGIFKHKQIAPPLFFNFKIEIPFEFLMLYPNFIANHDLKNGWIQVVVRKRTDLIFEYCCSLHTQLTV